MAIFFLSLWPIIYIKDMTAFFHKRRRKIIVSQHKHLKSTIYIFSIISDCHCSNRCSKYHSTILLHDKLHLTKAREILCIPSTKLLRIKSSLINLSATCMHLNRRAAKSQFFIHQTSDIFITTLICLNLYSPCK